MEIISINEGAVVDVALEQFPGLSKNRFIK